MKGKFWAIFERLQIAQKVAIFLAIIDVQKIAVDFKKSPNGRKIAKSGHPEQLFSINKKIKNSQQLVTTTS
jgi:hypothetical protein